MPVSDWIVGLVIVGAVLEADLGRRVLGWWRGIRPLNATAIVVPLFVKGLDAPTKITKGLGQQAHAVSG